jgi:hypothetical protein
MTLQEKLSHDEIRTLCDIARRAEAGNFNPFKYLDSEIVKQYIHYLSMMESQRRLTRADKRKYQSSRIGSPFSY